MLVRHLSYFVTLAREKHFARAAEACNVAQPTLSAAIRKLEEDLQVPLVVRGHRFLGLTPEGETVLAWGRQILTDYESLRADLSGLRQGLTGTLRLGVVPTAMPAVSALTTRFAAAHPAATVEIRSMTSRAIRQGVDAFELDGGLTYLDGEPLDTVRHIPLYRERYAFATHRGNRHAGRGTMSWAEAVGERLCLLHEDMQNRRILNRIAASAGLSIEAAVVSDSFLGVFSHLMRGEWSSIVPHSFGPMFGRPADLALIDLVEPAVSQLVGLMLSKREPPSPMTQALALAAAKAGFDPDRAAMGGDEGNNDEAGG
ncbi:transcriptional regulator (plasmid) [Azospirillum sp. B510]|uniref:LysR family transcriptional regulator n=1 Tax=Azospirillum sp. (strain B510) TaxID=137722 RepID=UPI0001C4CE26|nr:LysR family transcriptional regulator [Azospirillum sp. B510]BAI76254.1 transcriptional regulator [Azospirillum sp. B510]